MVPGVRPVGGLALGLFIVPLAGAAVEHVEPRDAGAASGTLSTVQQLGSALGAAVAGIWFFAPIHLPTSPQGPDAGTHLDPVTSGWLAGAEDGLVVAAIACAVAAIATVALQRRRRQAA
ncbi:hypothetical protein [Arthrobacter sp. M4]|uniref:hypothetical protein n=1 Tax=Arthrobacter sp. M4 TaxID=218160 RepID=UPI001CDD2171|nr:hypothetical protein [Arthrobacter sp. M4]MCA4134237.1 hypothetical protein [Arthrobacter sp. M4]